ncbi:MAG TPA: efflux RND transporter periplasmic adaptor subunit [Alphaproteobacteria bacterium]|nr:efflux RND transporter periplasmic adaptor subunit [Alphaproteobacteria bacterium]
MKRSYLIALIVAVAAALWLASPVVERLVRPSVDDAAQGESTASAPAARAGDEAEPIRVRVRRSVATPHVDHLILTGRTEPARQATLRAETAGRIVAVEARKGAMVEQDEVIVRLDPADRAASLAEATALLEQRRIEYDAARKLTDKGFQSQTRLAEARADLEAAQAQQQRIALDIERTEIRAPFDGVLQARSVEIGDYVGIGDPVATFVDLDPLLAVAEVSEREISGVDRNAQATVRLVSGERISGPLRYVSSVGAEGTRTFRIEVELPNPDSGLPAGMTAEVRLPVRTVPAHAMSAAVLTLDDEGIVGVKAVDADDVVRFHPVEVVADGANGLWVAGLPAELRLITVGQEFVLPGQKVVPVPEDAVPDAAKAVSGGGS